jgi:hypothetical protein
LVKPGTLPGFFFGYSVKARTMPDLSVALRGHDIIVSRPSVGLSITYRKQGRILEAVEPLRTDPSAEELIFLVRAWKAAFAKAQSLGWLN